MIVAAPAVPGARPAVASGMDTFPTPATRHPHPAARAVVTVWAVAALALLGSIAGAQRLVPVASGLDQPIALTHAGDGSGRLFVAEQGGLVRVIADAAVQSEPYLDLRARTAGRGERGLLGLAFHPDFGRTGRLYVHYTDREGNTVVSELRAEPPSAATVDVATERVVLTLAQPFGNHNGGQIAFGPDGFLYVGLGDGGSGGDPLGAGQDLGTPLGAILRIDVDGPPPYAVPADNPFVGVAGARPEIWASGLRNPWRFSFDRATGDLWIADVGQNAVEEVNLQPASSPGGENYGWRIMEGDRCFAPPRDCDAGGLTAPVLTYTHASGWGRSVTGGYVYRGQDVEGLAGRYVFGDYVSGRVFVAEARGGAWHARVLLQAAFRVSSFGEDERGELYVVDHGGRVFRFAP
jgi:glucose/arabinose dehydrogenase